VILPFLNRLNTVDVRIGPGGRRIKRLTEPLLYSCKVRAMFCRAVIPEGFETDLASIPWPVCLIFRPDGPWARAAVLHDWLYSDVQVSRFLADAMFRVAMEDDCVPLPCRIAGFWAVRLFARPHKRKLELRMAWRLMDEMRLT